MKRFLVLAAGLIIGNMFVVPLFFHRTIQEGFYIGLLAAVIILIVGAFSQPAK